MKTVLTSYIQLTKPSIMLLVIFTGSTALILEGSLLSDPFRFILVLAGLYLTGGCANALNQYFEREIDADMTRTSRRRPLPTGKLSPLHALIFSISIGIIGLMIFVLFFNWFTALLSLGTILFYSLYYTLYLKPNTAQNIVWGGIAGAMAPVGAWAAATGEMNLAPWLLFLLIFLWTPPHFWALALFCQDDYRRVKLPMMPIVKGEKSTLRQMMGYTILLFIASLAMIYFSPGWIYATTAIILGIVFIRKILQVMKDSSQRKLRGLFGYSIIYLFALFTAVIVDKLLNI